MRHPSDAPRALVIYESMFHNTEKIAEAVARGLRQGRWDATDVDVRWAGQRLDGIDLIVLGAPTHAFSLSRPSTRAGAVRRGAPAGRAEVGLREWLATVPVATDESPVLAVFDTRASRLRRLPTSAARTIARLAHRRMFRILGRPQAFLVEDVDGPLCTGEVERAAAWGKNLAETYA